MKEGGYTLNRGGIKLVPPKNPLRNPPRRAPAPTGRRPTVGQTAPMPGRLAGQTREEIARCGADVTRRGGPTGACRGGSGRGPVQRRRRAWRSVGPHAKAIPCLIRSDFLGSPIRRIAGVVMSFAFIFPGQGSQAVGMGRELADAFATARDVFEEVDSALGERLSDLIWQGPSETLTLTANAQPALMAVSLAAVRALEAEFGIRVSQAAYVAGHSLGEYSALAAAGALTISDAARLLRRRGQAMQAAVPVGHGAMAALIGKVDVDIAEVIALEGSVDGVVAVANDNNIGNVVISGARAGVDRAISFAKTKGVKAIPLPVSAPFHSPLMAPAAVDMERALATVDIRRPVIPVVANVTARPVQEPADIRRLLVEQVTGRVRWRESVEWMAESTARGGGGVSTFVETGAGKQLSGMVRRNAPEAVVTALNVPADLEAFAKSFS